jgi:U3 small nucleolar RNA-associated protein 3
LTYASTLAFYIHLAALPPSSASASDSTRPDLSTHPILPRLLQLKEGVSMLEDLDFAAGSVSDKNPLLPRGFGEDEEDDLDEDADEELIELMRAKRELMARMQEAGVTPPDEDEEDEEDEDEEWRSLGLEEGELEELMRDAEDEDEEEEDEDEDEDDEEDEDEDEEEESEEDEEFEIPETLIKAKKGTKGKADSEQKVSKKTKKADKIAAPNGAISASGFVPLEEPAFYSSGPKKSKSSSSSAWFANTDDTLGDPTALLDADATDKAQRRRSLQFHTAKIASTANRREKARQARMSGDEDLPRRDRRAARDAALRKNGPAGAEGEDLDGREWTKEDRQRAREVRGEDDDEAGDAEGLDRDEAEGYYELIKRRKTDTQSRKEAEHEANQAAHL